MTPLEEAVLFATRAHGGQSRKAPEGAVLIPYITHPLDVMTRLVRHGIKDQVTLAAAVLHDTVEDCGIAYEVLVEVFGREIADVVMEVTDPPGMSKRKAKDLQVVRAPTMSRHAKLVKLADKTSNVADILSNPPGWKPEAITGYTLSCGRVVAAIGPVNEGLEAEFAAAYQAVVGAV